MAATTRPGHLDRLRQDAKKQQKMNEPIMPYSCIILIQVARYPFVYQVSARNFPVPGPFPSNNACNDEVSKLLAASQNGEMNRSQPLVRVSSNSPAR